MNSYKYSVLTVTLCTLSLFSINSTNLNAEELSYRPVNPNFGGSALNGSYLLNNATLQRPEKRRRRSDPIEEFNENIQSSILNRISRDVADRILGENADDAGSFSVGGTDITYNTVGDEVEINIIDSGNGGTTTIRVPSPTF